MRNLHPVEQQEGERRLSKRGGERERAMLIAVKLLIYFLHFYGSAHFVIVTTGGNMEKGRQQGKGKLILLQRCRLQLGDSTRPDLTLIRVGKQYVDALQLRVTMRVLNRGSLAPERGVGRCNCNCTD